MQSPQGPEVGTLRQTQGKKYFSFQALFDTVQKERGRLSVEKPGCFSILLQVP